MLLKILMFIGIGVLGYRAIRTWGHRVFVSRRQDIQSKKNPQRFNKADAVDAEFVDLNE